ncbi:MAG TPA: M1 family metallopeptidase [Chitinophagaceae bacterium]|nr:M1 family metallopeptidase [Chitinophagaceae bacterium]
MLKKLLSLTILVSVLVLHSQGQSYWQQRVKYKMDVALDVQTNIIKGVQAIEYTNNSPDTLKVLFFHMYWNAFQPNSMMDVRNRELSRRVVDDKTDWDFQIADKIIRLKPEETGYQKLNLVKINGKPQQTELQETILKVVLSKPIAPKAKTLIETEFEARVPLMVRRGGRESAEGVKYSMAQWYPKLVEYNERGWQANPYVGREFFGVWGDYDVNITLNKEFVIAGTGYLQNPNEIGYGYEAKGAKVTRPAGNTLTWRFSAPNVHDFVWAADPDFKHETRTSRDGLVLHAFYKISPLNLQKIFSLLPASTKAIFSNNTGLFIRNYEYEWQHVLENIDKTLPYIEKYFGKYPYRQFSFIQGGSGAMEYPMATLLTGAGESVIYHEFLHSWIPMVMSNNESLEAWIDEGFATYAENKVIAWKNGDSIRNSLAEVYASYIKLAKSEYEEPLTTHADHFNTKYGYTVSAYDKGAVFYEQLGYVIGAANRDRMFQELYRKHSFKHVGVDDIIRISENVSNMQLDWYRQYFVNTTRTINYGIDSLWQEGPKMKIRLKNTGTMPMPIDLMLTFKDGSRHLAYIPQYLCFGSKPAEDSAVKRSVHEPWKWTNPNYVVEVDANLVNLRLVEIDPSGRMADVDRRDNRLEIAW